MGFNIVIITLRGNTVFWKSYEITFRGVKNEFKFRKCIECSYR
ncbi:hypothetical protein WX45_00595 [Clostridium ljungdahlii DSM 13528]|uniref:Uncharacterized protein n=1 Tax=Clostridium ljungdahlii (strain ATCC 55383 / DSM 13528 / PETC) TaxID=748727 RepID=A0ABX2TR61_CLOLD|nr:Hypothetical protein CLAU_1756 [Clostridium autoethanogenum DSM 10061]OAA85359.1 hypothetical protein WX45_00595 [Clostridium ljungdahlii DSM 13528]OVY51757.1 hypothetical protein WX72_00631 [Clostridium autoethanogenum]